MILLNFGNFIIFRIKKEQFLKFYNIILKNKKINSLIKKLLIFRYFNIQYFIFHLKISNLKKLADFPNN